MVFIFGTNYSLTIVLPFILIALGIVFFLTTYIKDNIGKLRLRIKKKEKKHEKEEIDFNHEFLHLKKELPHLSTIDSLDSIISLTKQFLSNKLNIQNEFTFEELPRNKLDWQVIELTKRLSDLKYSGREITRDEINHLTDYLSKVLKVKYFDESKKEEHKPSFIPRIIFPKFPRIIFKFPHHSKPHEKIHPQKELKPIRINIKLPERIVINPFAIFGRKKRIEISAQKKESLKKSIVELKRQSLSHLNKTEHKKVKSRIYKLLKLISKEEHNISNLESGSLKRFIKSAYKLSTEITRKEDEEGHNTIGSIRDVLSHAKLEHKIPEIPKPVKKEHHYHNHKHKINLFERIRMNWQSLKVLKLIKKAESKSLSHPLIAKKLYDEALIMYYKLPIDKEENIAIKLDRFYEKIHSHHEKELISIKHNNKKATREALKHFERYRNYIILENNTLNNNLRSSVSEIKKKTAEHIAKTKDKKVKSNLLKFLRTVSAEESRVFALEESSINKVFEKASSLIKFMSRTESKEGYDTYIAIKKLFSHLKIDHKLPKNDYLEIKVKELARLEPIPGRYEIKNLSSRYPEIKVVEDFDEIPGSEEEIKNFPEIEKIIEPRLKQINIRAPEIKIIPKQKVEIQPPRYPEKKISDRMKKLIEEKENVYSKLKELERKELERFRNTQRMTIHEDFGYHDFLKSLKPKTELHQENRIKKILEAK